MPYVEISSKRPGRIDIQTNFVDRFLIKELPGANWDGEFWHAPCTWASCTILRGLFGDQLEVGPQLLEWSWQEYKARIEPAMKLRLALEIPDEFKDTPAAKVIMSWRGTRTLADGSPLDLRPFQEAGVLFFYYAVSAGLGDPMGSGKTTQLINLLKLLHELGEDPFPCLVVPPNGVKKTWAREFAMWFPEASIEIVAGSVEARREQLATPADVYVVNWDSLRLHSRLAAYGSYALRGCRECDKTLLQIHDDALQRLTDLKEQIKQASDGLSEASTEFIDELNAHLAIVTKAYRDAKRNSEPSTCEKCPRELNAIEWRTVIADEAHRARNPKSKQTRALWAVSKPATRKPWATGTPIADGIDGLWSPLHFMAPDEWPVKTKFLDRFAEITFNVWGGMNVLGIKDQNRTEFFKIFDPRFRRLPKDIILPHLPPKVPMPPYTTEMSPKQAKAYKQMLKHMMTELDDGTLLAAPNPLVRTIRLLQFASAFAEVQDGHVVMGLPSCKVDLMEELVCDGGDLDGEQVVFFAESEKLIRLCARQLEKMKIDFGLITGPTSLDERDHNEQAFQNGDLQIILATMGAGREGITLTAAPVLVRLQRSYRPEFNQQSEDRVHRIGSERHSIVRIIDAVTPDTVEIGQIGVLLGKYGRQEEVNRDKETLRKILNGEGELPDVIQLSAA